MSRKRQLPVFECTALDAKAWSTSDIIEAI